MNNNKILQYLLQKEEQRYIESKEWAKTFRYIAISLIASLTICACFYMYYVVPVEDEIMSADNGSQIIESSVIGRDNNNGLQSEKN